MKNKICITIDKRINKLINEDMKNTGNNRSQVIENILKTHYLASVLLGEFQDENRD